MYKNKARLEHEANEEDADTPFDMDAVSIPTILTKSHAVSKIYRDKVIFHFRFFSFTYSSLSAWIRSMDFSRFHFGCSRFLSSPFFRPLLPSSGCAETPITVVA